MHTHTMWQTINMLILTLHDEAPRDRDGTNIPNTEYSFNFAIAIVSTLWSHTLINPKSHDADVSVSKWFKMILPS